MKLTLILFGRRQRLPGKNLMLINLSYLERDDYLEDWIMVSLNQNFSRIASITIDKCIMKL